jgi:hypothetical protein
VPAIAPITTFLHILSFYINYLEINRPPFGSPNHHASLMQLSADLPLLSSGTSGRFSGEASNHDQR